MSTTQTGRLWFTDLANLCTLLEDLEQRGELDGWGPAEYRAFLDKPYRWDTEWERLQSADRTCGRCHGEGEIQVNPSWRRDPQCVIDVRCPDCHGTGEIEAVAT